MNQIRLLESVFLIAVVLTCAAGLECAQAEPTPEEKESARFYGTLLSTLGTHIERFEFTFGGESKSNRADRNNMIRVITINRHDLPIILEDIQITALAPMSASDLEGGSRDTLLVPLEVEIGKFIYKEPKHVITQFWRKPASGDIPATPTPTPLPATPTPLPATEIKALGFRVASMTVRELHLENGTFEYHRILHDDKEGELKEDLVVEEINLLVSNLKYNRYTGTSELAPATFTARLRTAAAKPTLIKAIGSIVPEYFPFSFKADGVITNLNIPDLQPLIPYSAGIYIDNGTADITVKAECYADRLTLDHVAQLYNVKTSSTGSILNPFMYLARSQMEDIRRQELKYQVVYILGDKETDFGKAYGRAIGDALGKEIGGRLAAALTYKAPLTIVNTFLGIFTKPFGGLGNVFKPARVRPTPTPKIQRTPSPTPQGQ